MINDIDFNKVKNKKIIIYGAGTYGEIAYKGLTTLNISIDCFADQAQKESERFGIKIIDPSDIKDEENTLVIIASINSYTEMADALKKYEKIEICHMLALLKTKWDESSLSEMAREQKNSYSRYEDVVENYELHELTVTHCEIVLTEKCSLRCKDCSNFMQYYTSPEDLDYEDIIASFDRFIATIDKLLELRLLGGEPFIYKNIDKIINHYVSNTKICHITIFTNSTIVPGDEIIKAMQNDKVSVHMSNYGNISRNINKLDRLFKDKDIKHFIHNYEEWCDMGNPKICQNYSDAEILKVYRSCTSRNCHTFYRGKLYICPRSAHGDRLNFFKTLKDEYVDFNKDDNVLTQREKISKLINRQVPIVACNFCKGISSLNLEIPAAVQVSR